MLELGIKTLLAYLIGALNGSLVLGKLVGGPDVRSFGSGNAGGTNALRARGKWFALGVMIIDVGKGYVAAAYVPLLTWPGLSAGGHAAAELIGLACAAAAIVGHCYPVWFGFAGGKGAATSIGALLGLAPALVPAALVTWLLVVGLTGFVGLATMLATAVLPVVMAATGSLADRPLFWFLVMLALFIVFTHRSNVSRMLRREENRMTGLMILRRRA